MDSIERERDEIMAALNALPRRVSERCLVAMAIEPDARGAYAVMIGKVVFNVVGAWSAAA